jgi:hypothetical protein
MNDPAYKAGLQKTKISPPLMGGDKGEGENFQPITPTLAIPHQGGGN